MARYGKIDVRMWGDAKYLSLSAPPPNAQTLWVYLLSGPHRTSIPGLFVAGEAMLAEALRWPVRGFRAAFAELAEQGMVQADTKSRVIWIPKAIAYNPPESPNVVRSWRSYWDEIPECDLKAVAFRTLKAFTEGFGEGFAKAFRQAIGEGVSGPPRDPLGESLTGAGAGAGAGAGEARSGEAFDGLDEFDPDDPLKAREAMRKAFEAAWNAAGLMKLDRLNRSLWTKLEGLMLDPDWRKIWRDALARAGKCPVLVTGAGGKRGPMDPRQFLGDVDFAHAILRGMFDPRDPSKPTASNGKTFSTDPFGDLERKWAAEGSLPEDMR